MRNLRADTVSVKPIPDGNGAVCVLLLLVRRQRRPGDRIPGMTDLECARADSEERSWLGAFEAFARADEEAPLEAEDLELYATTARMLGRDEDALAALERAHHGYLERGETRRAA